MASLNLPFTTLAGHRQIRCNVEQHRCSSNEFEMKASTLRKCMIPLPQIRTTSASASASDSADHLYTNELRKESSPNEILQEAVKVARQKFTQELFQSKDKNVSLAKALLYVAAEDEGFIAFNQEIDSRSFLSERSHMSVPTGIKVWDGIEEMPLAGRTISEWLNELDTIAKEVEAELVSRAIGCDVVEVLEAVNVVLFELRGFKRESVLLDSKCSYLHSVLSCRCGSGILLSIIYIEVCRRIGLTIVGSPVGEDFLIWPQMDYPEELFRVTSGHSLFAILNGKCVEDPSALASDLTCSSLLGLEIATNKDIVAIALGNLIRLYWRRASRSSHGLMLTTPLRKNGFDRSISPLLRPQDLRLAIMASERLLTLQHNNWPLRRDYGMMLYYNRDYGKAIQELSHCMAFVPTEEEEILEQFVEKLHVLRLESSWNSQGNEGRLRVP